MQTPEQAKIWRAANREKLREYNRNWRLAHRESELAKEKERRTVNRESRRVDNAAKLAANPDHNRARYHGLTVEEVASMRERQGNLCGLCFNPLPVGSNTHIDHDHVTGRIRGLLCARCNWHIAVLENRPAEWLKRAQQWIRSEAA